jgi:hypothetical protein
LLLTVAQVAPAQFASRDSKRKGPRALALLELAPGGTARLIPICIMYEGKFFDAGAYKATPVPMAVEAETVYEGVRTGVSQGLFTVTGARQVGDTWIGLGFWDPEGATRKPQSETRVQEPPKEEVDKPPVLRRPTPGKPRPAEPQPAPAAPAPPSATAPAPRPSVEEDKDRPVLRRGKPAPRLAEANPSETVPVSPATDNVQLIPAISDAGGADLRPYTYDLKPEEEQKLRKKILDLASDQVRARAKQLAAESVEPSSRRGVAVPKSLPPNFEGAQLRVFDLSNTNDAVLVLTAKARVDQRSTAKEPAKAGQVYYVTLVAREDLYGELRTAFSNVTDARHLDVLPRLELIDAVDADGDGRGELLFRRISDAGSAFVVYMVVGDQLYPLFQGTPGQ